MIRNVALFKLNDGYDAAELAQITACLCALNPPGCLSYTLGHDLALREGSWSLAIVADFVDEAAYRAYDSDAEHNRLRGLMAPFIEQVARAQFSLEG